MGSVCLVATVVYLNSIPGEFVFDDKLIQHDPRIHLKTSFSTIFLTDYWYQYQGNPADLYRPLTIASYALNYAVAGLDSRAFHVVNVALHALVSGLLVVLVDAVLRDLRLAAVTGLLFATHPIHTEAVTSIVGRAELLSSLFILLALYLHARSYSVWRAGPRLWLPLALLVYFAGLLSKETAIVGLGLLLVVEGAMRAGGSVTRPRAAQAAGWRTAEAWHVLRVWLLYTSVALLYLSMRLRVIGRFLQEPPALSYITLLFGQPLVTRIATAGKVFAIYLGLLLYPVTLSADYSYNQVPLEHNLLSGGTVLGVLAAVGVSGALIWAWRAGTIPVAFGVMFFAVAYSIVSNALVPIGVLVGERLMYLPSAGFCVAIAWIWVAAERWYGAVRRAWPRRVVTTALTAVLVLYGVRTFRRNLDWWTPESLYAATVEASPDCMEAQYNYGTVLMGRGDGERNRLALQHLLRAYGLRKDYFPLLVNLTVVYLELGEPSQAREVALEGLRGYPESARLKSLVAIAERRMRAGEGNG